MEEDREMSVNEIKSTLRNYGHRYSYTNRNGIILTRTGKKEIGYWEEIEGVLILLDLKEV